LERLLDFLVNSGVQGITLFGLAGEYYKLSDEERRRIQRLSLAHTVGRLTRIVSITDHSTEVARQRAKEAEQAGADALMILPPVLFAPDPRALHEHVAEVAREIHLPIIIQYAPNQTGLRLPAEFFTSLSRECSNVEYVKVDSTPAGPMISNLIESSAARIKPLVGYAGLQMVDAFSRGAVACMPGSSLVEWYLSIYRRIVQGDQEAAAAEHARLLPLLNFIMQSLEFVIQCEKTLLQWRGIIRSNYCRRPGVSLLKDDLRTLRDLFSVQMQHSQQLVNDFRIELPVESR
jgi:4-hydroxy-tetrahydrodipicolinate synthase